ncbi:MAG: DegT/DnrJ/EryC1/StrS family aminotransferase [Treponema sp.]|nr:DegT/DnrJ/EryC1/StrS family aminotransferase [Treponema sp.]
MKIGLMDVKRQHLEYADEYESAALEVLRSGQYIMGENVKSFEKEFAEYIGVKYAVSCGNGTDALNIALKAIGIKPGDEVITVPFTFFATAEAIASVGAIPVFVDVDENSYCINVNKIEGFITEKTKAILPVHFYGQPADMDLINKIAQKHNLFVIEDSAQASGSLYKGRKTGSLGDVGCFSFFPTKTLGCDGDGGMLTTNNLQIAEAAQSLRVHGSGLSGLHTYNYLHGKNVLNEAEDIDLSQPKYYNFLVGQNSRLDEIQAAILRKKLTHLDDFIKRRRDHAAYYNEHLSKTSYILPKEIEGSMNTYYLYALQHEKADLIKQILKENGVGTGTYYPVPLNEQRAFENIVLKNDYPVSKRLSKNTFTIPVYPELTKEEMDYIISILKKI